MRYGGQGLLFFLFLTTIGCRTFIDAASATFITATLSLERFSHFINKVI